MGCQQLGMTQGTVPLSLSIDDASPVPSAGAESTWMMPYGPTIQLIDPLIQMCFADWMHAHMPKYKVGDQVWLSTKNLNINWPLRKLTKRQIDIQSCTLCHPMLLF